MQRTNVIVSSAAAAGVAATLVVTVLPFVHFAYRSDRAHVAIETAASLIALIVAQLVFGRYRREPSFDRLLLSTGLAVIAATNLLLSLVPALVTGADDRFDTWAPVGGRLLGASLLAASAFAPRVALARPARSAAVALGSAAAALAAIALAAWLAGDGLPAAIPADVSPSGSERPRIVGNASVLAIQLVATALYAAAAVGYARRASDRGDELDAWIAGAMTLGAFARLNYFLFPSLYSQWVYTGDLLRLGSFLLLLAGAAREIAANQDAAARALLTEERRRIARDLHDGLAQELAYIFRLARKSAGDGATAADLGHLERAAARALDESRSAIAVLTRPLDEPLDVIVARAAEDVGVREGLRVRLRLAEGIAAPLEVREALARIVREAVTNAARHAAASEIEVLLEGGAGIFLAVRDDGRGFDPTTTGSAGFGLHSMRERAAAVGGELSVTSRPGAGTRVEVALP